MVFKAKIGHQTIKNQSLVTYFLYKLSVLDVDFRFFRSLNKKN